MDDAALVHELEPTVETLLERHLLASKEWFPHELIPYSRGRDAVPGERVERGRRRSRRRQIDDAVRSSLIVNLLTEDNLPYYFRSIEQMFGADGAWGTWARRWTAEEGRHSMAIYGYLMTTRAVDPVDLERGRMAQVSGGMTPDPESTATGSSTYPAGAGDEDRPPQHGQADRRPGRLRGDVAGGRRREPPSPLLPRPRRGGDRRQPEHDDGRHRAPGRRFLDARARYPRFRRPRRGDRQGGRLRPGDPPRADPRPGAPPPLADRQDRRASTPTASRPANG